MAQKGQLNVVGDFGQEREPKIDSQRTINMYVLKTPEGKSPSTLAPMAGRKNILEIIGAIEVRQLYTFKDYMYAVVEDEIYKIDSLFNKTLLGSITTTSGYVAVNANVNQIIFIDGSNGYIYDTTTSTFTKITDPGFPSNPSDVTFLDGYFISNSSETNKFYVSALNNGLSWDVLNFAEIQSKPDVLIGLKTLHRRLFLFGKKITEVWYNAGKSDFPLARDDNLLLEYGCAADGSIVTGYQKLFWLSGDENGVGSVMMTDGTVPIPISTPALDYQIQSYTDFTDARGFVYKIDGHVFYELSFTTDNKTWIYDATTNMWFEGETLDENRQLGNCHTFYKNEHYIGAYNSGIIYNLSSQYLTDDDQPILRKRICGHFSDPSLKNIVVGRVNLDIVAGEGGLIDTPGAGVNKPLYAEPKVYLSFSKDGGKSFSNRHVATLGKVGDRTHRCIFRRLGKARDWVFRFEVISKNKVYFLSASIDYKIIGR